MRATENLGARASKHLFKFCEQIEQLKILIDRSSPLFLVYPGRSPGMMLLLRNLRTTTTTSSTTTESEIQGTAQARLANFVVVVSSTTPNTVQSRRPASQASAGMNPLFLGDFLSVLCIFLSS